MVEPQGFQTTCWVLIEQASRGGEDARERFAARYLDVVRSYLTNRWSGTAMIDELDDAVQEVFLECFRRGGVLHRVHESPPESFRAFLHGVSRNVARRLEKRAGRYRRRHPVLDVDPERIEGREPSQSRVFDRAWARMLFRQAGELQRERASTAGEDALRRIELLELRSRDGLPIRAIAARWGMDAGLVHKQYAKARKEFETALRQVVSFHYPGLTDAEVESKCLELIGLLEA